MTSSNSSAKTFGWQFSGSIAVPSFLIILLNVGKQIDNLRTNHQGVYVLQDNSFKFLTKVCGDFFMLFSWWPLNSIPLLQASCDRQYLEASPKFVAFTCGLVRGSLANLGMAKNLKESNLYNARGGRGEHNCDSRGDLYACVQVPSSSAEELMS